ncbi:hypothetical protein IPV69_05425 [Humisphaera borealis]|uniref:Uncharacterized protein n=1 Tax=Humisphaera borealis TaxID=2807512 RepID=A0A7M2WZD7_9BACT|nr:hypothetical protein IPV69_05425 [Humisphaera borealis]
MAPGCAVLGVAASKASRTTVKPAYMGFGNQTVGVMVTTDRGTQVDFPRLQLDIAQSVQSKMQGAQANKAEELKGTQFPAAAGPTAIFAYQRNHPEYDVEPIAKIAPKLGVTRLIYIEIEGFALNPADVLELFRGEVTGRVRVVEITDGVGKVVFSDAVSGVFPEHSGPDGTPNLTRAVTYRGAIDAFGTAIVQKFVEYETN